ncbi:MAG: DUF4037 domain-containing protein [Candidatus Uhrbacteria bacterium]|nr:DUF4037 domain-containing protein [Candidatus Uhrbacteria bacterium]
MLKQFYLKDRKQIAIDIKKFFKDDFFVRYPELQKQVSIVIVGSVATANYDKYSDVDLDVICSNKKDEKRILKIIQSYKKELRTRGIPMQIHAPRTYTEIENQLSVWERDAMLREYSQAIIVSDQGNRFKKIQNKYQWYPWHVFKEKLLWLFAEMIFEYEERYSVAIRRKDFYFEEAIKMKILRYLFAIILLTNKKYPAFDKHVYQDILKVNKLPKDFLKVVNRLLRSHDFKKNKKLLLEIIGIVEDYLIKKRYIKKESRQYWVDLRPKYKVEMK